MHAFIANDQNSAVKRHICIPNEVNKELLAIGPKEKPKYWHSMQDWLLYTYKIRRTLETKWTFLSELSVFVFEIGLFIP